MSSQSGLNSKRLTNRFPRHVFWTPVSRIRLRQRYFTPVMLLSGWCVCLRSLLLLLPWFPFMPKANVSAIALACSSVRYCSAVFSFFSPDRNCCNNFFCCSKVLPCNSFAICSFTLRKKSTAWKSLVVVSVFIIYQFFWCAYVNYRIPKFKIYRVKEANLVKVHDMPKVPTRQNVNPVYGCNRNVIRIVQACCA